MIRVGVMLAGVALAAGGAIAQSGGETCAQARTIDRSFYSFSTAGALADAPAGSCNAAGATEMQHCVWFRYTPASAADVRLVASFTVGAPYEGILAVYEGSCEALSEVACDAGASADVVFGAEIGKTYYVQIGSVGVASAGGQTLLTVLVLGDDVGKCDGAPIACGETLEFDSSVLNADGPAGSCGGGSATAHAAWFTHTAANDGEVLVSLDLPAATTGSLAVYTGVCGALTEIACEAGSGEIRFDAVGGETYVVQAGVASGAGGVSAITVCCDCPAPCACDLNGDGVLNLDDIDLFAEAFVGGDPAADMDGNGVFNLDDITVFARCFVAGCP